MFVVINRAQYCFNTSNMHRCKRHGGNYSARFCFRQIGGFSKINQISKFELFNFICMLDALSITRKSSGVLMVPDIEGSFQHQDRIISCGLLKVRG